MSALEECAFDVGGAALPRFFGRLREEAASGVLCVESGEALSRAFFREGRLCGAVVFGHFKPLGVFLLESGVIDISALDASLAVMAKERKPQGQILVELGAIDPAQLERGLYDQQVANGEAFLHLTEGRARFEAGADLPGWTSAVEIEPEVVVLGACRAAEGRDLVRAILADLSGDRVRLKAPTEATAARFGLGTVEARALEPLKAGCAIEDLAGGAGLDLGDALTLVAALSCFGLIEGLAGGEPIDVLLPAGGRGPAIEEDSTAGQDVASETRETAAAAPATDEKREARGKGRARRETGDHRERRSRLLKRAFRNIPGAERLSAAREARRASQPQAGESSKAVESSAPQAAPAAEERRQRMAKNRRSEEARRFEAEIRAWHKSITGQDYYQRLRVQRDASPAEIKAAYLGLVKRFHPDRGSAMGLDGETTSRLNVVFEGIKEAYDVISDPEARARYDARLDAGVTESDAGHERRVRAARMQFRKGVVLFRKKDFEGALPLLKEAYRTDPTNGEWAVHYAWALYTVGPADKVKAEVLRTLKRAAGRETGAEMAYYYLGLLARIEGDLESAARYFKRALRLKENYPEAATELRLVKRRMERKAQSPTSRLMRKILGGK